MFDATSPYDGKDLLQPRHDSQQLQRSKGRLDLVFEACDGETSPARLYQEGALKVRLPKTRAPALREAVIINTAGGLTGGDKVSIAVKMGIGARATISGQACEKIYKSSGGDAEIVSTVDLADGAHLEWLVQPTILFDRSRMRRSMSVAMDANARLLAVEAVVFGRTAMAEVMAAGCISDSWHIRRQGALVYADTFRLDGDINNALASLSVLGGNSAMASLVYAAPDAESRRDNMRGILEGAACIAACSAWNGLLVTRLVAHDGYALTHSLVHVLTHFRGRAMPRVWMI